MILDPLYFLFVGPAILLSLWAQWRISSAYRRASQIPAGRRGLTGAQTAAAILREANVAGVRIAGRRRGADRPLLAGRRRCCG